MQDVVRELEGKLHIYVGTPEGDPKKIPDIDINDFVTKWD